MLNPCPRAEAVREMFTFVTPKETFTPRHVSEGVLNAMTPLIHVTTQAEGNKLHDERRLYRHMGHGFRRYAARFGRCMVTIIARGFVCGSPKYILSMPASSSVIGILWRCG